MLHELPLDGTKLQTSQTTGPCQRVAHHNSRRPHTVTTSPVAPGWTAGPTSSPHCHSRHWQACDVTQTCAVTCAYKYFRLLRLVSTPRGIDLIPALASVLVLDQHCLQPQSSFWRTSMVCDARQPLPAETVPTLEPLMANGLSYQINVNCQCFGAAISDTYKSRRAENVDS